MNKKIALDIVNKLKIRYPDAKCSLDFTTPFEMLVAVSLSAQCTDERVNKVTPFLFLRCKTLEDYISIPINELENLVHSCGFYKNKAKNIKQAAQDVLEIFDGIVPKNHKDLTKLAGVGRKSANVIMLEAFGIASGIAVDTHAKRISNLMGLSKFKEPEKIEKDLLKIFPKEYLKDVNHLLVWHGRNTCIARRPKCESCIVNMYCGNYIKRKKHDKTTY